MFVVKDESSETLICEVKQTYNSVCAERENMSIKFLGTGYYKEDK